MRHEPEPQVDAKDIQMGTAALLGLGLLLSVIILLAVAIMGGPVDQIPDMLRP
jgi:hypothetical protein